MKQSSRWLALAALMMAVGCQRTSTTTSGAGATGGESASTAATTTTAAEPAAAQAGAATDGQEVTMPNGLKYVDMVVGSGVVAETGKGVTVHYTGWLTDHTKFDSSLDRGQPFSFKLGAGEVIRGWDEGIKGMHVGGKRKLTIPPDLGYGANGTPGGPIPANATLVFDVELLGVN